MHACYYCNEPAPIEIEPGGEDDIDVCDADLDEAIEATGSGGISDSPAGAICIICGGEATNHIDATFTEPIWVCVDHVERAMAETAGFPTDPNVEF